MNRLTSDQQFVLDQIMFRLGGGNKSFSSTEFHPDFSYVTIGGYAGTGKTYLINEIRKEIKSKWKNINVAFVAFTGKASSVLGVKLEESKTLEEFDFCGTIHSLMYQPEFHYDKNLKRMVITKWIKKSGLKDAYDLIFIDEASMVNKELWRDISEYDIPIIAVGDHGQLPPIGDGFNLIEKPMYTLTEIKRQALDNPIIQLSQDIRNGKEIPFGYYNDQNKGVFKLSWNNPECKKIFDNINFKDENLIILCGMNKTRVMLNQMVRDKLTFNRPEPYPSERLVCLRNNYRNKIMNGQIGTLLFLMYEKKNIYNITIQMDGFSEPHGSIIHNCCFGKENYDEAFAELHEKSKFYKKVVKESGYDQIDLFDFGYCVSCHKAQGSEWKKVILFQERSYYWDNDFYKRWLYTASTRAKEKLFIIK